MYSSGAAEGCRRSVGPAFTPGHHARPVQPAKAGGREDLFCRPPSRARTGTHHGTRRERRAYRSCAALQQEPRMVSTLGDPRAALGGLARTPGVLWPQPEPFYVSATHEHTKAVAAATALQAFSRSSGLADAALQPDQEKLPDARRLFWISDANRRLDACLRPDAHRRLDVSLWRDAHRRLDTSLRRDAHRRPESPLHRLGIGRWVVRKGGNSRDGDEEKQECGATSARGHTSHKPSRPARSPDV
jgi:hypothetical protein